MLKANVEIRTLKERFIFIKDNCFTPFGEWSAWVKNKPCQVLLHFGSGKAKPIVPTAKVGEQSKA